MVEELLREFRRRFKRVKVLALVGKSGTGKSFRVRLVAAKQRAQLIVDDGLLIREDRILAGRSAKVETNYLTAVKTALFETPEHRAEVLEALRSQRFRRILLVGTSEKMVQIIAERLTLPPVARILRIEDVARPEEIQEALRSRGEGKHVIPVPAWELRREHESLLAHRIRIFFERTFFHWGHKSVEKSVVRPPFHDPGVYRRSVPPAKEALSQMVIHCVDEFDHRIHVKRVQVRGSGKKNFKISLFLSVNYDIELGRSLQTLRDYVTGHIERYTGCVLDEIQISVV